jgi:hypothetical protein
VPAEITVVRREGVTSLSGIHLRDELSPVTNKEIPTSVWGFLLFEP